MLKTKPESYWIKRGEIMALSLFHEMASRVPAYKDFLRLNEVNHKHVRTINDFKKLPIIDKDNYLRRYPLKDLCWDGKFSERQWVLSSTSGSTGEPFYFPRTYLQDKHYAVSAELYLRENFDIENKTTLYIDAFAMGSWIGGLFTYEAIHRVAAKGYSISIITPGTNKLEVVNDVKRLGHFFDQVIIGCYPPMMKDILDLGVEEGLDWSSFKIGLIFSAEGFGEQFREHVHRIAGIKDYFLGSLNHYGTVDQGTVGHETPTSIFIRKTAYENSKLFHELFGPNRKQPTLVQYLPEFFYFESLENKILCSSYSGLPLVRYDVKDSGSVLTNYQIEKAFNLVDKNFDNELHSLRLDEHRWNLPFVYITEREDFSIKLAGGMIYPEEIRKAMLLKEVVSKTTGKFTMEVVNNKKMQPKLIVNVELKKHILANKELTKTIQDSILEILLKENTEYTNNYKYYGRQLLPQVKLWEYEHKNYFAGRGKHSWVKINKV